jgi:tRNA A-37 threonylcarbamoyl transferase component Bud32
MEDSYIFIKENVEEHEYKIHKYVYDLGIVKTPRIYSYNKKTKIMKMENLKIDNIASMYDEHGKYLQNQDIQYIYEEIRNIILKLYENNIIYVDITPYNFIESKTGIYIIDFEHAFKVKDSKKFFKKNKEKIEDVNYLYDFLFNGVNEFNPNFHYSGGVEDD